MPTTVLHALKAGDVITRSDKPLVHIVNWYHMEEHCSHCLKRSNELKKCSKCQEIFYCDKRCQSNDWKHHKNECKVFRHSNFEITEWEWEKRLLLRLLFCIAIDNTFSKKRHKLVNGSDVCLRDIDVHALNVIQDDNKMSDIWDVYQLFRKCDLNFELNVIIYWFAFIDTSKNIIIQLIPYFSSQITNDGYDQESKIHYIPDLAVGIYIEFSSVSHSCLPNCSIVNTGLKSYEIRATKSIPIGNTLTVSAVDLMQKRDDIKEQLDILCIDCRCVLCQTIDESNDSNDYNELIDSHEQLIDLLSEDMSEDMNDDTSDDLEELLTITSQLMVVSEQSYGRYSRETTFILLNMRWILHVKRIPHLCQWCCHQYIDNVRVTKGAIYLPI